MATKWYTLTVRVGSDEPIKAQADATPVLARAAREALGIEGTAYVSDIYLIPEDERRGS